VISPAGRKYTATDPAASNPKRIDLLLLQKVSIVFFTGVFLPRGPGGYLSPEGAKKSVRVDRFTDILPVRQSRHRGIPYNPQRKE